MASISKEKNGHKTIQFVGADEKRRSIRLGDITMEDAKNFKTRVEDLLASKLLNRAVGRETALWLNDLPPFYYGRLVAVDLVEPRETISTPLEAFLTNYIAARTDAKQNTVTVWGHTKRTLVAHFTAAKPIQEITPADAQAWKASLVAQKLAENTIRRRCGIAKQFFRAAIKQKLIQSNPFAELEAAIRSNKKRDYFVSRAEAEAVLAACPDSQWKLLFALSRYAGLRCPSEHLGLRWEGVNWERSRMLVHSPKTEHHDGKETRLVPIFPELRPHLEAVWAEAGKPKTGDVITRYRQPNCNLRTQLMRIVKAAKLQPWPKLFQNLRSTCETEIAQKFGIQVACQWIGNTPAVALKHYLQVTEEDFAKAVQKAVHNPVHNPVHQGPISRDNDGQTQTSETQKTPVATAVLEKKPEIPFLALQGKMGRTGLEPVTSTV